MISIEHIKAKIRELDPLQPTLVKLSILVSNERSTISDFVNLIKFDQAMSLRVLRLANSALSSPVTTITDIREAVVRLGGGRILRDLIAESLKSTMSESLVQYGYSENELWYHSIAAATASEILSSKVGQLVNGVVFTAALLHDIGKLILTRIVPDSLMSKVWSTVIQEKMCCEMAEKKVLGFSHSEIGALILESWDLPESLITAIREHHNPDYIDKVNDFVTISNYVSRVIGYGIGYEGMDIFLNSKSAERLGLTKTSVETICAYTAIKTRDIISSYQQG